MVSQAQHDLQVEFIQNSNIQQTAVSPQSNMYLGSISHPKIIMQEMAAGQDGEITAVLGAYDASSDARVCLTTPTQNSTYCIHITPSGGHVKVDNVLEEGSEFDFESTDELKIYRCEDKIIYQQNGRYLAATQLSGNNFKLYGLAEVFAANSLNLHLEFNPQ
ncbi:MAG: hypothetical protein AAFP82_21270 [Bacteroidota bacterium]